MHQLRDLECNLDTKRKILQEALKPLSFRGQEQKAGKLFPIGRSFNGIRAVTYPNESHWLRHAKFGLSTRSEATTNKLQISQFGTHQPFVPGQRARLYDKS